MYLKSTYLREIELVRDNADPGSSQIKNLPKWNLDDLYSSENDKNLTRDLKWLDKECTKFETQEYFKPSILLKKFDEAAKKNDIKMKSIHDYQKLLSSKLI